MQLIRATRDDPVAYVAEVARARGLQVEGSGSDLMIECPYGGDRTPSWHVWLDGDGKLAAYCHRAVCQDRDTPAHLKELGIGPEVGLLSDPAKKRHRARVIPLPHLRGWWLDLPADPESGDEVYAYEDADGDVAYWIIRRPDKRFVAATPEDHCTNPSCLYTGQPVHLHQPSRPILYHLPEIRAAIQRGELIYAVEGERCAEAAARWLGITATTSPFGSNSWRDELADDLLGAREVVILPDRDESGEQYARDVARSLVRRGIPARVVRLPGLGEGEDVEDWLAVKADPKRLDEARDALRQELERLVDEAKPLDEAGLRAWESAGNTATDPWVPRNYQRATAAELAHSSTRPEALVEELIWPATVHLVAGESGIGKTWLALEVAAAVASGRAVLGRATAGPKPVLYVALDLVEWAVAERLRTVLAAWPGAEERLEVVTAADPELDIRRPEVQTFFRREVEKQGAALLVVDTLDRTHGADEARPSDMAPVMTAWEALARETGAAILLLHHVRKGDREGGRGAWKRTPDDVRGASTIVAHCPVVLVLSQDPQDRDHLFCAAKSNFAPVDPMDLRRLDTGLIVRTFVVARTAVTDDAIIERIASLTEPITESALAQLLAAETKATAEAVRNRLRRLRRGGRIPEDLVRKDENGQVIYGPSTDTAI